MKSPNTPLEVGPHPVKIERTNQMFVKRSLLYLGNVSAPNTISSSNNYVIFLTFGALSLLNAYLTLNAVGSIKYSKS